MRRRSGNKPGRMKLGKGSGPSRMKEQCANKSEGSKQSRRRRLPRKGASCLKNRYRAICTS